MLAVCTTAIALAASVLTVQLVARADAATSYSPYGHLERLSQSADGVRAVGWAIDPSSPTRSLGVYTTVDGRRSVTAIANLVRSDVARTHRGAGADHGFSLTVPATEGPHTVCVYARNIYHGNDTRLLCRTSTVDYGPHGKIDYVHGAHGGYAVKGYVVDGNAWTTPVTVIATVDGRRTTALANRLTTEVPRTWPTRGSAHGLSVFLPASQGTHRICITARNIGLGSDNGFGCRTVLLDERPRGHLDFLGQYAGKLRIRGWAYDVDARTTPLRVVLTVDGHASTVVANAGRPDVARTLAGVGNYHGFDVSRSVAEGAHTVSVVAQNIDLGSGNLTLAARSVRLAFTPTAYLASLTPADNSVRAQGWAVDPDTSQPLAVRLAVDGRPVRTVHADHQGPRGARYPGRNFGDSVTTVSGRHSVCATAVNALYGSHDSAPSCRTITLTLSPHGHFDAATRVASSTDIRVSGWAFDWDTPHPLSVGVTVDGVARPTLTATTSRPDVPRAYPGAGSLHGFGATLAANDGEHRICLTARNAGAGSDVTLGCRVVNAVHPTTPTSPRYLKAAGGYGGATVSWTPPASDGGAPPTSYVVRVLPGVHQVTVPGTATSATVAGLAVKGHYYFQVYAHNVAGYSPGATSAWFYTAAGPAPQRSPAPVATSRYIRNIRGSSSTELARMRAEGVADAARNPSNHRYLVLLDIGGQDYADGGVVLSATTRFVSNADLVRDIDAYVDGYHSAQHGTAPVTIGIGTNNDMDVSYSSGRQWATAVVNPIASHAARYAGLSIAGANDIEPGFRSGYTATRSWLAGYLAATSRPFVFNGSADGCAWTVTGRGCNNGWSMSGLYTLAAGAAPTRTVNLPQIYNYTMAAQWKYISLTGVVGRHPRINFGGPLTELTACRQASSCGSLSGYTAWQAMWNNLQSDSRLRQTSLPYATDLRIDW